MNSIKIKNNEYNFIKVFIGNNIEDNDNILNTLIISDPTTLSKLAASAFKINSDFDHICGPCIGSKLIQVFIWNKNITLIKKKTKRGSC